jgi:Mn2+/Fe2+ NRAMP family transporter
LSKQINKPGLSDMIKNQKKWWITPVLIIVILVIVLIIFGNNPKIAPFIYERF